MSVYKRGTKGVFYMDFVCNGIRVFKSTGKFTKREAKLDEATERKKILSESSMTPRELAAKLPLSKAIEQVYMERWKHTKNAKKTYQQADRLLKHLGDIPLGKIDEAATIKLTRKLEATDVEVGTINRYLAALKTILKHHKQPWEHIRLKKERQGRIRVISRAEEATAVGLLRNTPHNPRRQYYAEVADLAEVLVDTGMRLSELLNLKYDDVDYQANLISIWFNKADRPRSIPMTKRACSILERRQITNPVKPFSITKFQAAKAWAWVRRMMQLQHDKEFVLHALRHTTASRLVNKGVDLYVVKEWLGHSSIQVTEKYAHLSPTKLVHAVKALEGIN